jgi:hypothetical protein
MIEQVEQSEGWMILPFDCLGPKHPSSDPIPSFKRVLDHAVSSGIRVVRASNGVARLLRAPC